ncbi:Peptidyl-tRNA hydrolase [Acidipropionibacterium acidipropionici ATCC 4875]|uniref:Peptidyl-tRNA hydrolase n=1 Tax=Acidipropionibacterium acidipropionici (strain ATCC 4875 / DSM 20272 / JCM 6432 / NBRC 12425 / NCIMB 8070 / 4) TaxID=1171373 RepID=K7SHV3_ACIA4|nr:aminoacyl-tRNA hydrolase [Acidipropionibacterium acidipropionici]AFV88830.1 Peptidyl-tRNA hydrolase [Acidipropionibacterium acidipropionici ATCC 4875]
MTQPWLVVGLGNPGPAYAATRHSVGAMVVAELCRRAGETLSSARGLRAETARTRISDAGLGMPAAQAVPVVLMRSRTYMNDSGVAVRKVADFDRIPVGRIIVVHDEIDLDLGRIRIKAGGGDNGHNGLRSMRSHLRSGDFLRVRVGVGRPPGRQDPADYVLKKFAAGERAEADLQVSLAADAVECLMTQGLGAAQNRFNS